MTLRYVQAAAVSAFVCGLSVVPASAQLRDGGVLPPEESAVVTVAGCLIKGNQVRGGNEDKYVLAHPRKGPVNSVQEQSCSANPSSNALELDNPHKGQISDAMLGRWVEISGRLEKETSTNPDNLRELDVATAKVIPYVPPPPPRAAAAPAPAQPAAEPEPATPIATSGQTPAPAPAPAPALPQTASNAPLVGLMGWLAVAGGLLLRSFRSQRG